MYVFYLPAPKTHYTQDLAFNKDTPIFCTSKYLFIFVKNGVVEEIETDVL